MLLLHRVLVPLPVKLPLADREIDTDPLLVKDTLGQAERVGDVEVEKVTLGHWEGEAETLPVFVMEGLVLVL